MLPDRVSNPGPLTYESGALPIALRGPAKIKVSNKLGPQEQGVGGRAVWRSTVSLGQHMKGGIKPFPVAVVSFPGPKRSLEHGSSLKACTGFILKPN